MDRRGAASKGKGIAKMPFSEMGHQPQRRMLENTATIHPTSAAKPPGKAPLSSPAMRQVLRQCLAHPHRFASYKAICQWLQREYGLSIAYKTVYKLVRYRLRAKLKVPRKSHLKNP